jgi:lysophospholipase L1-like esterase
MQPPPRRPTSSQRRPAPRAKPDRRLLYGAAAALLVILAAWALWPSAASTVTNLDSRGTAIVAFGDSLTAGVGANAEDSYPSHLAAALGTDLLNAGTSGDTSAAALARIDEVLARDPRIVIVGLGGNDFLRSISIAATEANLREIVRRVHDAGAMVVLLGFRFPSLKANYEEMYERVAEEEKCLLVPDVLDGILSDAVLRSDPIHPNGKGYALMAERIAEPLADLIAEADKAR